MTVDDSGSALLGRVSREKQIDQIGDSQRDGWLHEEIDRSHPAGLSHTSQSVAAGAVPKCLLV